MGVDDDDGILWQSWYLDDGTIVGRCEAVTSLFDKLVSTLPTVGLALNPSKCVLWGPGIQAQQDMLPTIPHDFGLDHPIRSVPIVVYEPCSG